MTGSFFEGLCFLVSKCATAVACDDAFCYHPSNIGLEIIDVALKIKIPNLADLIKRYRSCAPIKQIADEFGVSVMTLYVILRDNNIPLRDKSTRPNRRRAFPVDKMISRFLAGESVKALADSFSVSRATISLHLRERDIPIRGRSEAERLKWTKIHKSRRLIERQCSGAWKAARAREHSLSERISRAKTCHIRLTRIGRYEDEIFRALCNAGFSVSRQHPLGRYNLDLAINEPRIAVEVSIGCSFKHSSVRRERLEYILDQGWSVFAVCIPYHTREKARLAVITEKCIAFAEVLRRDKPARSQYGMIGRNGEPVSPGGLDLPRRPRVLGF